MSKHGDLIRLATLSVSLFGILFGVSQITPQTHSGSLAEAPEIERQIRIELPALAPEIHFDAAALIPRRAELQRGETLSGLFARLGAEAGEAHRLITELASKDLIDPRRVQRGQVFTLFFERDRLHSAELLIEAGRRAFVKRHSDGSYRAFELQSRLQPKPIVISGEIVTSLYENAIKAGVADQQIVDFAGIFAFDIDFQREIHPGDRFEMVYESLQDERGQIIRNGELLYVALDGRDAQKSYYRFTPSDDGETDYFQPNGESATRFLMKTPINGARLSSRFGTRRHPISGYTRLHKGTDFAAPTGTPIYAAGHGTVERASRYGGYGHYIRIRHANGYKTAYAHLSRYARGLKRGSRVRQGQTIGYVGSTGASTGPHLHYEVYQNGRPIDVMRLNLPTGRKLADTPAILADFQAARDAVDRLRGVDIDTLDPEAGAPHSQPSPAP